MTADEYRAMYGLCYHCGLTSGELRQRNSDGIKQRYATGYLDVLRANGVEARAALGPPAPNASRTSTPSRPSATVPSRLRKFGTVLPTSTATCNSSPAA
jgi:hypothetical protein